jgi:3-phenylpropionate/trans-cinnamate dioxygenase ferredoxin subunit
MDDALEGFLPTVRLDDLQLNRLKRVKTDNGTVVVALAQSGAEARISAFSPICPHAMGDLSYGTVFQGEVECPVHGYRFDVRTGACTHPGDESPVQVYPVQVVDGLVYVKVMKPKWMLD